MQTQRIEYDDTTVRRFIWASIIFGVVGMLVGILVACQLVWPTLNFGIPYTVFSRLRPLHTNAVIFAFVGNMLFAGIYYSIQRLFKARLASDFLSNLHFWGWQAIIASAAITLPLGITQSKEYAELEWPIDLAVVLIWVVFAINFFWTMAKRNEKQIYVAVWFYIATIVTIAVLYITNNLALPLTLGKSYPIYAGVQDALVQWWYGHNAVAFFLTTPILGIMYYYLPKAAERPVYSYRLSVVHFWALIFIYIWAGPHHLLYTSLPDWAQSLGMLFSVMLWAPSWGGMLNGLLTLRGAWHKLREDPVLKFLVAGVTFYGMSTFEGPLLSIKTVNGLAHYTDWIIGHVHSGALGWNGLMAAGMFYWLVPRLYGTKLHSVKGADLHFWLATIGIVLYMVSMWISGVTQGLMLRALNPDGSLLHPDFLETLAAIQLPYLVRALGGAMYFTGLILMCWNLIVTALAGKAVKTTVEVVVVPKPPTPPGEGLVGIILGKPFVFSGLILILVMAIGFMTSAMVAMVLMGAIFLLSLLAWVVNTRDKKAGRKSWFAIIEGNGFAFTAMTLVAILIGGVAELLPTILIHQSLPTDGAKYQKPYTVLELQGRDVYVREGCYLCHSQQVRPFLAETMRYGEHSQIEEFVYDHPFQWGSKRTGPDLQREGGKQPSLWHYNHMIDPRATSKGSNMPAYPWLASNKIDTKLGEKKLRTMQKLGVPYSNAQIDFAEKDQQTQAETVLKDIGADGLAWDSELVALIAYLQKVGRSQGIAFDAPSARAVGMSEGGR
ncbi:MAG: cytochrome-c oxidase, cbb3-type subunit I [Proteobacteria bacterium]|nr:cytochrome-c oxidase, cbb3-type subunit I [Cystobacterineae bacterium]MCL2258592.1 cytochrome-c oxidase, cbb3-type subunit I [Cystobacterineae bacterium]MCL2314966.1 cytochrome-c oxidase, cbb3-type subunit I [Pseudomonadota bacterium]